MFELRLVLVFCLFVAVGVVEAQTLNEQITDRSVIELERGGLKIRFSVAESKALFNQLYRETDPALPENAYMPPVMKERLTWLRKNAIIVAKPTFPPGFRPQTDLSVMIFAMANYCDAPAMNIRNMPCVEVFPNVAMILLRIGFMMLKPNEAFKNSFAVWMGHEAIHLENSPEWFVKIKPGPALVAEEIRAWHKTIRDLVAPLRRVDRPLYDQHIQMDDLLGPCKYRLPCPGFEARVRQLVSSR